VTSKADRTDVLAELRLAQNELEDIQARVQESLAEAHTAFDRPVSDERGYLTGQLEAAHAHMVGMKVAQQALLGAFERPRVRDAWHRDEAERLFFRVLSDYAYHYSRFPATVRFVENWIERCGLPSRAGPEREAER
jgi:hypothetical protein